MKKKTQESNNKEKQERPEDESPLGRPQFRLSLGHGEVKVYIATSFCESWIDQPSLKI